MEKRQQKKTVDKKIAWMGESIALERRKKEQELKTKMRLFLILFRNICTYGNQRDYNEYW